MLSKKEKKKAQRIFALTTVSLVFVLIILLFSRPTATSEIRFVNYPDFGIYIPENFSIHGIDVSKYQSDIDWQRVKNMKSKDIQLGFCFMKATQGIQGKDPFFQRNWQQAKAGGLVRGAYHFFIGSKDGAKQAANFLSSVRFSPGDLPPVLDIEQSNGATVQQLRTEAKKFLDIVEKAVGVKPIIYTNIDFYERTLSEGFEEYPLWIAHYYQMQAPRINRHWHFWQHSDRGRVNGINGKVDFNVFQGDSNDFRQFLLQ